MKKPSEEELVAYLYGDAPSPGEIERALEADPELRRRFGELRQLRSALDAQRVPEPSSDFETRLWRRLHPRLSRRRRFSFDLHAWRLAPAWLAAGLALVALGYLIGRGPIRSTPPAPVAAAFSPEARERLLRASLGTHLAGSERLLAEIVNQPADQPELLAEEREWARALTEANRFFRRAAERAGDRQALALLDELEPVLAELANGEPESTSDVLEARRRIEDRDLLFKVRVLGARLDRESVANPATPTPRNLS